MNDLTLTRSSALENSKNALVKDLKVVVGDANALLNEVINSTSEEFAAARTKIEARLGDARSRLRDARISVAESACHAANATGKYVEENPWKTVGLTAAVAMIIGILSSRR